MNWAALLGGFVGAFAGTPLGVLVVVALIWRAQRKIAAATPPPAAPVQHESALHLVKTEHPESAS